MNSEDRARALGESGLSRKMATEKPGKIAMARRFLTRRLCSNIWNPLDSPSFQKSD